MGLKTCIRCNQEKPLSDFGSDRGQKDFLNIYCRLCARIKYNESRRKNLEQYKKTKRDWKRSHPHITWAGATLARHKQYGIEIRLETKILSEIVQESKYCPLCNVKLDWSIDKGRTLDTSPTLDRINNETYIDENNIMIICHKCNTSKGARTLKEFLEYCKSVICNTSSIAFI